MNNKTGTVEMLRHQGKHKVKQVGKRNAEWKYCKKSIKGPKTVPRPSSQTDKWLHKMEKSEEYTKNKNYPNKQVGSGCGEAKMLGFTGLGKDLILLLNYSTREWDGFSKQNHRRFSQFEKNINSEIFRSLINPKEDSSREIYLKIYHHSTAKISNNKNVEKVREKWLHGKEN